MGSRSVIFMAYAHMEPAPEPRPGPTRMPLFFAHWMKSATTRKYPAYPLLTMTSISNAACLRA